MDWELERARHLLRAAEALVQCAGTSLAFRGQKIGVSRHGQERPTREMETTPREQSRLPLTADRPSVSAPPLREISDAANAASRGRRRTMTLKSAPWK